MLNLSISQKLYFEFVEFLFEEIYLFGWQEGVVLPLAYLHNPMNLRV